MNSISPSLSPVALDTLSTPFLHIDGAIVRKNLEKLAVYAGAHDLAWRPHTKTHKSIRLAQLQVAYGACGLTAAKVGEAECMAPLSPSTLIAYPLLDAPRCRRGAELARDYSILVAVDSALAAERLNAAAEAAGSTIRLLVDLDVGFHRTGLQSPQDALRLASFIDGLPAVVLAGLFVYPGQINCPPAEQGPLLKAAGDLIQETLALWEAQGLAAPIVSGGSTPTCFQSHLVPGLTEIRPGTNIFNDMNTVHGGYCCLEDCAARIVATVVSDAVPGQIVLDAGSKTLTSDPCGPAPASGFGFLPGYPNARIAKLSEEHGQVDVRACPRVPSLGERVAVIPNHICPCVNLQDRFWWTENPESPPELVPVDARGALS
ncbi:MAG TPA: alanine racemase [Verrucomicrobiales bacterium]|nr:alanine racemase [Verrucomicrobiales bacterium]